MTAAEEAPCLQLKSRQMGAKELAAVRIQARSRIEEPAPWGQAVRKMTREAELGLGFGWKRRKEEVVERGGTIVGEGGGRGGEEGGKEEKGG